MSIRTADLVNLGYLPLRHHEPDYDVNLRAGVYGFRVERRDPRTGAYVHVEGEDSDLANVSIWKLADAKEGVHDRPMAAWSTVFAALVVKPEDDASAGAGSETTLRSDGKQQVQPLRLAADTDGDKRFAPKTPGYPSWASRLPRGWPVQVMAGTEEHSQEDALYPAFAGLVAAERAGGANLSTALLDLDGDSRPDGERRALLHRHLRVVRKPTGMGFDGTSTIAMQAGFSGRDGGAGLLLIADSAGAAPAPSTGEDPTPSDGDTSIREKGGAAPGTTDRGGTAPRTSARGAQAVIGATGWRGGGPLLVPGPGDQHQIGVSGDGEPIFATHVNADSIIYGHGGDGPWHFLDSIYRDPGPHPMRTRVHFEFDPKEPHTWIGGAGAGKWKASAESILYVQKKKIGDPKGGPGDGRLPPDTQPGDTGGGGPGRVIDPPPWPPEPPPPPPIGGGAGDGTISRTGGPADPPPTPPPLPPTPPREGGNIDDPSGPGDGSENGDTSLRNPWDNPPPEPPTPPIDDPLNQDPGADGDPYDREPDPNDPARKLFPPRFDEPRRFPGAAIARSKPVLGADLGDWNRDLASSAMEIAVPAILFRPQKFSGGAPVDLRNDPSPAAADVGFHDENSPVTARIEAAYPGGCTPSYTRAPGVGRYGGGTASCALSIMPAEVCHADDAQNYAPSGVAVSDVAMIALRERVRIAWGRPCLTAGAATMVRDGFSSILDSTGALVHASHDSAGAATTRKSLSTTAETFSVQAKWADGLGAITHLQGPSDQLLQLSGAPGVKLISSGAGPSSLLLADEGIDLTLIDGLCNIAPAGMTFWADYTHFPLRYFAFQATGATGARIKALGDFSTTESKAGGYEGIIAVTDSSTRLAASFMPAFTGDVTKPAGSAVTTLAAGSASVLSSGTLADARLSTNVVRKDADAILGAHTYDFTGAVMCIPILSADPGSPVEGQFWFRSDIASMRVRTGGVTYSRAFA